MNIRAGEEKGPNWLPRASSGEKGTGNRGLYAQLHITRPEDGTGVLAENLQPFINGAATNLTQTHAQI